MHSRALRLIAALLFLLSTAFAQTAKAPADPAAIKARLDQIVEADASAKSFMGAALVVKGDQVLLNKGYGSANLEWNLANTPTTKFRLGSLTKQFTAACVLLLAERGQLSLTDPVKKHLPDAPVAWDAITIHHLLSHTSGIPNFTSFPDYQNTKTLPTTPEKTMARFRDRPLDFTPGDRFAYSNSGYIVLGAIIEKVSGMSYPRFVQENLFTPLGMTNSGYDAFETVVPQRASGYVRGAKGFANAPYLDMTIPFAAGGLYSTTEDLLKWEQALTGGKLLKAASWEKMTTPVKDTYGYGLDITTPSNGHKRIAHGGGIEGFNTYMAHYPEDGKGALTVVVLANLNGPAAQTMAARLASVAFGETVVLPGERKAITVPAKVLAEYVGNYRAPNGFAFNITLEGDQLYTQATGQPKIAIFPETESKFFLKVVDAQLEFFRDPSGKVTHAVLNQGGRELKAMKE